MDVLDSIQLEYDGKVKTIQLCAGDLSQIPPEWNTDFLLISAFPNDYSPTPTSVVGALNKRGISVRKLAQNKMEDLRAHFYCWYSKPVSEVFPDHALLPFKRLICFENPVFGLRSSAADVGTLFRGLTTVSNIGSDLNVVSSLLKTGDSGHNMAVMLKAMVSGCAHWMLAGLPIQTFSIVLFNREDLDSAKKKYTDLIQTFGQLKKSIGELEKKQKEASESYSYDFYLSYSGQDDNFAHQFSKAMKCQAASIRFFDERETLSEESSWQNKMYENVKSSKKVVHFLSPLFLKAAECVEQFNISYCLNNSVGSLLAPLFLDEKTPLPNYMKSIQWFNCADYNMNKMSDAVKQIYQAFVAEQKMPRELLKGSSASKADMGGIAPSYDVFVSYAHKNKDVMTALKEKLDPSLVVFLDSQELRTGFQWQQAIYESLERSTVVFAVLTEDYFSSAVCREEFNLSIASVLTSQKPKYLVPLTPTGEFKMPTEYEKVRTFPLGEKEKINIYCRTAYELVMVDGKTSGLIPQKTFEGCLSWKNAGSFDNLVGSARKAFTQSWVKSVGSVKDKLDKPVEPKYHNLVVLSSSIRVDIAKAVKTLAMKMFKSGKKDFVVNCQQDFKEHEMSRIIDSSDAILVILDDSFLNDSQCLSFLNLSLLDCRFSTQKRISTVEKDAKLTSNKLYPRLIDYRFNMSDPHWEKMDLGKNFGLSKGHINCLASALFYVLGSAEERKALPDGRVPVLKNVLSL